MKHRHLVLLGAGISPQYLYADVLALDGPNAPRCSQQTCPYGLSDFFDFSQSHPFGTQIQLPTVLCNLKVQPPFCYNASWFEDFGTDPAYSPSDPDNDAVPPTALPQQ